MTIQNLLNERQEAIRSLISRMLISDQKTLVDLLKAHYGIETNQSVLSRDLRKLGVVKSKTDQEMFYTLPILDSTAELLKLAVIDVKYNEVMVVVKTHPGLAAFVGDYIDQQSDLESMGCIAGENVVFIASQSIKKIKELYEAICQKLFFKKPFSDLTSLND